MISFQKIKYALANFHPQKLPDDGSKRGAVLIPIFEKEGKLLVLFTKRTDELPTHKGQISFPGGKIDKQDDSLLSCALRETFEEIGIEADKIEILGELNQSKTNSSNILLSAYVSKLQYPFTLKINEQEVKEIIEIPLKILMQEKLWKKSLFRLDAEELEVWFFQFGEHMIWGATAKLIRELTSIIKTKF